MILALDKRSIQILSFFSIKFLYKTICCSYSLQLPLQGNCNEYLRHMFPWSSKKNTNTFKADEIILSRAMFHHISSVHYKTAFQMKEIFSSFSSKKRYIVLLHQSHLSKISLKRVL